MKNIHARVKHLVQTHGTNNPEIIANELGIHIEYKDYNDLTKGYYINIARNKFIVINSNLDDYSKKIVLAHELGHAMLHSSKEIHFIREYSLFPRGKYEVEANKFAAELLINEQTIDKNILNDMSINQLSCYLEVPVELVEYKFRR